MSMSMAERGRLGGKVCSQAKKKAAASRVARLGGVLSTDKKSMLLKRRWLVGSIHLGHADALLDGWIEALQASKETYPEYVAQVTAQGKQPMPVHEWLAWRSAQKSMNEFLEGEQHGT